MQFDLTSKKQEGLFRERILRRDVVCDFSSNDYLSLSLDPRVQTAFQRGFSSYPAGSGGSMVIGGYHEVHHQLESAFCEALKADSAVLFASGYAANLGLMALLASANFTAIFDKALHASFYDGIKLSDVAYQRYPHQAYDVLSKKINALVQPAVLVTESVYSMGGHFTPLDTLVGLAKNLRGLIVDEAHAFGVYGQAGLGAVVHFGLTQTQVPLRMISFGKAMHAQGAIVVGKRDWIEALIQVSRSYIYSTAMSPAYACGLIDVFNLLRQADEKRQQLFENVRYFRQLVKGSKFNWGKSETPIQHLYLGCPHQALSLAESLMEAGLFCRAIRPPTVSVKASGIRVVLNAAHMHTQLERLVTLVEAS